MTFQRDDRAPALTLRKRCALPKPKQHRLENCVDLDAGRVSLLAPISWASHSSDSKIANQENHPGLLLQLAKDGHLSVSAALWISSRVGSTRAHVSD